MEKGGTPWVNFFLHRRTFFAHGVSPNYLIEYACPLTVLIGYRAFRAHKIDGGERTSSDAVNSFGFELEATVAPRVGADLSFFSFLVEI